MFGNPEMCGVLEKEILHFGKQGELMERVSVQLSQSERNDQLGTSGIGEFV